MSKKNNNGAGGRKPLADPKGAERRIRAWLLRTCPEEKPMIGDFRKDVTFAEVNRRMHGGENFYDICDCSESVQREIVFRELARLYGTKYDYWYNQSLNATLTRTINTSVSTFIVLLFIFVFGGASIKSFAFAMMLGVIIGTLTSMFIAAPTAYLIMGRKIKEEEYDK